jgi:small subunit ribosomal protein S14
MSYSNYNKMIGPLKVKPAKLKKFMKHNAPKERSCGFAKKRCVRCGRIKAHVGSFGLELCRQCFRDIAPKIGFKKYN